MSRHTRPAAILLGLFAISPLLVACPSSPSCSGSQRPYNNVCLDTVAITYIECTKGRGFDLTTELSGKLGGTFKVIADASVEAAYKQTQEENTVVALQIVSDCLKIAESSADTAANRSAAEESRQRADLIRQQVEETAHIEIAPNQARAGQSVLVSGTSFYPEETVAIYVHATLVTQIKVDGQGAFSATITVPKNALPGFQTAITVTGETSAKSAQAPFEALQ
ncbi:hypothetical protein [Pseudarthrobacter quantipunctorum]|uniref:IPT/TIG domain-containing protein n=1 Tax=Pseudarthrobacter quantipunctorum TaxID=3128980 RepID=A0ABZ2R6H9_9MICC